MANKDYAAHQSRPGTARAEKKKLCGSFLYGSGGREMLSGRECWQYLKMCGAVPSSGEKRAVPGIRWVKKRVAVNSLPCANQAQRYREPTSSPPGQWAGSRSITSLLAPGFVRPENLGGVVTSESPASGCFLVLPGSHSAGISPGFQF